MAAGLLGAGLSCPSKSPPSSTAPPPSELECTEIGCAPVFTVQFERREAWPRAHYRIEAVIDGEALTCEREIPLTCGDPAACPRPDVQLIEIGCGLAVGEQALGGLQFTADPPSRVEVRVFEGDQEIGAGTYEPDYDTLYPNGPDCPPTCTWASDAVLMVGPDMPL